MSVIKELRDSIKITLYERMTSPLIGSFVLSWIGFNWKLVLTLFFGDEKIATRIENAGALYRSTVETTDIGWIVINWPISTLLIGPAITSILAMWLLPILSPIPTLWKKEREIKADEKMNKLKGKELLSVEASNVIKQELRERQKEHQTQIEFIESSLKKARDNDLEEWKQKEVDLTTELESKTKTIERLEKVVEELNEKVISKGTSGPMKVKHPSELGLGSLNKIKIENEEDQGAEYWVERGSENFDQEIFEEALEDFKKALSFDNRNIPNLLNVVKTLEQLGRFKDTKDYILQLIKLDPKKSKNYEFRLDRNIKRGVLTGDDLQKWRTMGD